MNSAHSVTNLAVERLRTIVTEEQWMQHIFLTFRIVPCFMLELENTQRKIEDGIWGQLKS